MKRDERQRKKETVRDEIGNEMIMVTIRYPYLYTSYHMLSLPVL